jgi:hypothetical protein
MFKFGETAFIETQKFTILFFLSQHLEKGIKRKETFFAEKQKNFNFHFFCFHVAFIIDDEDFIFKRFGDFSEKKEIRPKTFQNYNYQPFVSQDQGDQIGRFSSIGQSFT